MSEQTEHPALRPAGGVSATHEFLKQQARHEKDPELAERHRRMRLEQAKAAGWVDDDEDDE